MHDRNFSVRFTGILPLVRYTPLVFGVVLVAMAPDSSLAGKIISLPLYSLIPQHQTQTVQDVSSSIDFIKQIRHMSGVISQRIHMTMWMKSICQVGFG
jgi:hypothetical protein